MRKKYGLRAVAVVAALGMATVGVLSTGAGAQSGGDPGVTAKDVTLGYISSQTGAAASTHKNAHKSCQARVDAENAKGGVNGRKIKLEIIDDKSGGGEPHRGAGPRPEPQRVRGGRQLRRSRSSPGGT